jgi:hypothetical protein
MNLNYTVYRFYVWWVVIRWSSYPCNHLFLYNQRSNENILYRQPLCENGWQSTAGRRRVARPFLIFFIPITAGSKLVVIGVPHHCHLLRKAFLNRPKPAVMGLGKPALTCVSVVVVG